VAAALRIIAACRTSRHHLVKVTLLKSLSFLAGLFRHQVPTKQISSSTKPFSRFGAGIRKQWLGITLPAKRRKNALDF
jgi:hypothetical protein